VSDTPQSDKRVRGLLLAAIALRAANAPESAKVCEEVADHLGSLSAEHSSDGTITVQGYSFPASLAAQSPLGGLAEVLAEYDRIVDGRLDPRDAEADFVMRGSDWREIRKALRSSEHTHKAVQAGAEEQGNLRPGNESQASTSHERSTFAEGLRVASEHLKRAALDWTHPARGGFREESEACATCLLDEAENILTLADPSAKLTKEEKR
jgi:hypothetical protein